jgi:hypothetical protein
MLSPLGKCEHPQGVIVVGGDHALAGEHPGTEEIVFGLGGGLCGGTKRPSRLLLVAEIE